jgi:ACDE family multidrug resistance protein
MLRISQPSSLVLLLLASTLGPMAGATIMPVLEAIRHDLGVSGTAAGLIITTHGLAIALASPLAGWLIDRWGVRLPLATGLIIYGLAGGAGVLTSSYPALIASRAVFGIGAALVFTGSTVALLALYQGPARDRVMGWRTGFTSLGGLAFPLLAGALGTLMSWHAAFGIYLVGVPVGLWALRAVPGGRRAHAIASAAGNETMLKLLARSRALVGVYAFMFTLMVMIYSVAVFLPQRLGELGIEAPILVSAFLLGMTATSTAVGFAYSRIRAGASYLAMMRFAATTWVVAFLILGMAAEPFLIAVATLFLGLGNGVLLSALTVLIAELVPESALGRATALQSTVIFLGQFVSPLLIGPVMSSTSITMGYLVVAMAAAAVLAVLLLIRPGAAATAVMPGLRLGGTHAGEAAGH